MERTQTLEYLNPMDLESNLHCKLCGLAGQPCHLPGLSFLICEVGPTPASKNSCEIHLRLWQKIPGQHVTAFETNVTSAFPSRAVLPASQPGPVYLVLLLLLSSGRAHLPGCPYLGPR